MGHTLGPSRALSVLAVTLVSLADYHKEIEGLSHDLELVSGAQRAPEK